MCVSKNSMASAGGGAAWATLDGNAAVEQDTFVTIDERDLAFAGRRCHEPGIEREKTVFLVEIRNAQHIRTQRAASHFGDGLLPGRQVGQLELLLRHLRNPRTRMGGTAAPAFLQAQTGGGDLHDPAPESSREAHRRVLSNEPEIYCTILSSWPGFGCLSG